MTMATLDRRSVLGLGGAVAVGVVLAPGVSLLAAPAERTEASGSCRWAMLIDVTRCPSDCTACLTACRKENNVPLFGEPSRDIHWIRKVQLRDTDHVRPSVNLPMMCFHCENPACVHVCPTGASFIRKDGLVLVDEHRCIGCRYCMIACPYKARSLVYHETKRTAESNPNVPIRSKGVVEKCTFCVHRLDNGQEPACVEACKQAGKSAMLFGDLNDPHSAIAERVRTVSTTTVRPDLGLKPRVHYQGL